MEKSNKYAGIKYFKFEDTAYFKDKAFIILKVNFDDEEFEDWYLDKILESEYRFDKPSFKNFDEKVEDCLTIISSQIFNWIKQYYVYGDYENENAAWYINETYYDEFIVLGTKNTEETAIYLSYHEYNDNSSIPTANTKMELLDEQDMKKEWK